MKKAKSFFLNFIYSIKITYKAARQYFVLKTALALLTSFFPFVNIYIWKNIINFLTDMKSYDGMSFLIINICVYMLFYLVTQLLGRASQYIEYKYNDRVNIFIENLMLDKFAEVDLAFYDSSKYRDKVSNTWAIRYSMTNLASVFFYMLQSSVTFVTALILFAKLNILYVLIVLGLSLPVFILKIKVNIMNNEFHKENANTDRKMGYFKYIFQNIGNSFDIRLFDLKDFFIGKYIKAWTEWYKKRKELTVKATVFTLISLVISTFVNQVLLYVLIIDKLAKKIIQIGDAAYYISIFSQFYDSTITLINILSWTQYAFQQVITVKEFMDLEPMIQKSGTLEPKEFGEITDRKSVV